MNLPQYTLQPSALTSITMIQITTDSSEENYLKYFRLQYIYIHRKSPFSMKSLIVKRYLMKFEQLTVQKFLLEYFDIA